MRMVKLSQIGFGYFYCNRKTIKRKKSPFHKEYVRIKAGRFARVGTRLSAREQLRACVKWDLVDRDFFIFSNFVRQYFRFRSVNFFQIFGDNYDESDAYIYHFLKNSVGGKKN